MQHDELLKCDDTESGVRVSAANRHSQANPSYSCTINAISPYKLASGSTCHNYSFDHAPHCPIETNGCSTDKDTGDFNIDAAWIFPELNLYNDIFRNSCNNHDTCYGTIGKSKSTCDNKFLSDMKNKCESKFDCDREWWQPPCPPHLIIEERRCKDMAQVYYTAVSSDSIALDSYQNAQAATQQCMAQ